jgi:RND family efflux transporter MFP subunit
MNMKLITALTSGIAAAAMLMSCSGKKTEQQLQPEKPISVQLSVPAGAASSASIEASGVVEASRTVSISTRIMGYITRMNVKAGDAVKAGQVLFTVNATDISAKKAQTDAMIAQAEAQLYTAQKDLDRYTTLYKQQSATAKELEQVTLQYQSAKASVESARQMRNEVNAQFSYTTVTAPFNGIVSQKMADAGSLVNPGMPVLMLEQSGKLQVSVSVPEKEIAAVKPGMEAQLEVEATNQHFSSRVQEIIPSSQFTGGQYIIKTDVPAEAAKKLYAGMYVHVRIHTPVTQSVTSTQDILVPEKALVMQDQLVGVYTVSSQQTAVLRWLRTGKRINGSVEVLSGLNNNESFILKSDGNLYNGAPVTVKK